MFNWLKRKIKKVEESDVGGSNPSTPAKHCVRVEDELYPYTLHLFHGVIMQAEIKVGDIKVKCMKCKRMTGAVVLTCYNSVSRSSQRNVGAFRVKCTSCSQEFKVIVSPLLCLSCPTQECHNLPSRNHWT